jgi:hypothetical protein
MTDKEQVLNIYPEAEIHHDWKKICYYRCKGKGIYIKGKWLFLCPDSNIYVSNDEIWAEGWKIIQCEMLKKLES